MNAKLAKGIRKATDYRNQTATPGVIDFPGVGKKIYQHPVMLKRMATRTKYVRFHPGEKTVKVATEVARFIVQSCPVWYARYRNTSIPSAYGPVQEMVVGKDKDTGEYRMEPKVELVPVAKPARLSTDCPKGRYRVAKKFVKRFGVDALAHATAVST